ncbi:MAG: outer membrane beta-barrel protein [Lewinellaceae bacterium]|nr:outer membrane beta-barrel protein [Lewinellaceae bacterium]
MKNEFDNRLTDKGWRSMRQVLDREMPEKRKRRPLIWWWMGAVLLLSLAGAGGWQLHKSAQPKQAPAVPVLKPAPPEPVVQSGDGKKHQTFPSSRPAEPSGPTLTGAFNTAHAKTGANTTAAPANKNPEPATTKSPGTGDPIQVDAIPVPVGGPMPEMIVETTPATSMSKASPLSPLPGKLFAMRSQKINAPALAPITWNNADKTQKHRSPARWSFGLSAGANTERFSSINGFSAGLVADWKPFRKWGFRAGIQYARYKPSAEKRPVVSLGNSEYVEATGNFSVIQDVVIPTDTMITTPASQNSESGVLVPVDRLHRLEMPLLTFWQPARFLRLYGGITTSYNLSTKASEQNYANNKIYFADSKDAINNLNDLTASNLPRWHADLTFGAGVRVGKHLEFNAFYQPRLGSSPNDTSLDFFGASNGNGSYQLSSQSLSTNATSRFFLNGILFF